MLHCIVPVLLAGLAQGCGGGGDSAPATFGQRAEVVDPPVTSPEQLVVGGRAVIQRVRNHAIAAIELNEGSFGVTAKAADHRVQRMCRSRC